MMIELSINQSARIRLIRQIRERTVLLKSQVRNYRMSHNYKLIIDNLSSS